jgi:hypothetical protein
MAVLQLNPVGMQSTTEGYVSSITIYSNGAPVVFTPDGNNQIGTGTAVSPAAATRLVGGMGNVGVHGQAIKLVTG